MRCEKRFSKSFCYEYLIAKAPRPQIHFLPKIKCTVSILYSAGDSTADLDYTSPFALELSRNGTATLDGASTVNTSAILRSSTNPSQNASLILPTNGRPGSLGFEGNIWIEVKTTHGCSPMFARFHVDPSVTTDQPKRASPSFYQKCEHPPSYLWGTRSLTCSKQLATPLNPLDSS